MTFKQPNEDERQLLTDTAVQVNLLASRFKEVAEELDKLANGEPTKYRLTDLHARSLMLVQSAKEVQNLLYLIALIDRCEALVIRPTPNLKG